MSTGIRRPTLDELGSPPPVEDIQRVVSRELQKAKTPHRFSELLAQTLTAIRSADLDTEMELRAELSKKFRLNHNQINADLFNLLTSQESGHDQSSYGAVDMSTAECMDWELDGFVPAKDQVILHGKAGSGKTTAAIGMSFAKIDGLGLLDYPIAVTPGKVLFISSDSGQTPLREVLEQSGYGEHLALSDGRFTVWAHSRTEGRKAWDASIAGCLALVKAVKTQGIGLVIIDSCKAVTTKAGLDYTNNPQVTALLTFFKEVVCQHCSVIWLNHDGTEKGMHAGAKAWQEVPSVVHHIEKAAQEQGRTDIKPIRSWSVTKCRMRTERQFWFYQQEETGKLELTAESTGQIVQDCSAAVLYLLRKAYQQGIKDLSIHEIKDDCLRMDYKNKTTMNTLTKLCRRKDIVRPRRGRYALAPGMIQKLALKGLLDKREQTASEASQEKGFRNFPPNSLGTLAQEDQEPVKPPDDWAGSWEEPSCSNGSEYISSHHPETSDGELAPSSPIGSSYDLIDDGWEIDGDDPMWAPRQCN